MTPRDWLDKAVAAKKDMDYIEAWRALRQYWQLRDGGAHEPPLGDRQAYCLSDTCNYYDY